MFSRATMHKFDKVLPSNHDRFEDQCYSRVVASIYVHTVKDLVKESPQKLIEIHAMSFVFVRKRYLLAIRYSFVCLPFYINI